MDTERSLPVRNIKMAVLRIIGTVILVHLVVVVSVGYGIHRYVRHSAELQIRNQVETLVSTVEELGSQLEPLIASLQGESEARDELNSAPRDIGSIAIQRLGDNQKLWEERVKRVAELPMARLLRNVIRKSVYDYCTGSERHTGYFFLFNSDSGINLAHGLDYTMELVKIGRGQNKAAIDSLNKAANDGGGCVVYKWDSQEKSDRQFKLACVKMIKSKIFDDNIGGAWLGTGMFIYEIDQNFDYLFYRFLLFMAGSCLILATCLGLLLYRPIDLFLQRLLDAIAAGILITRKRGAEEQILFANTAALELYGGAGQSVQLDNQNLDRLIPRRFEANRQPDGALGGLRLDYEVTIAHGMSRLIRDISRELSSGNGWTELVHSVSELKDSTSSDFASRKYLPPLLSKTGVELSLLGTSTVLLCDISGFVKTCDEMGIGVSEIGDELRRNINTITELVLKSGGAVEKFFGEKMLIHFGINRGTERSGASARNCVRLALQIRAALRSQRATQEGRFPDICCRMGIAASQVLACAIGNEQRSDFTLVGQAIIAAELLSQEADVDEILISQNVMTLLGERFEIGKLRNTTVLWSDKPLVAYPVERERPDASLERSSEGASQQTKFPSGSL